MDFALLPFGVKGTNDVLGFIMLAGVAVAACVVFYFLGRHAHQSHHARKARKHAAQHKDHPHHHPDHPHHHRD